MDMTELKAQRVAELKQRAEEIMSAGAAYWEDAVRFVSTARPGKTAAGFPETTAYLFNTGGVKWMMDPAYHYGFAAESEIEHIAELLSGFSFGIITHCHADHFQPALLQKMLHTPVKWVLCRTVEQWFRDSLPDFPEEKIIWLTENQEITLEGIRIVCLPGQHAEPGKPLVPSASYAVFLPEGTKLFFPGDSRKFDLPELPSERFDYVFGHVYLGRADNTLNEFPQTQEFAGMLLAANPGTVFLTHLYDLCRAPEDTWTERHAEMVRAILTARRPNLDVQIFLRGGSCEL